MNPAKCATNSLLKGLQLCVLTLLFVLCTNVGLSAQETANVIYVSPSGSDANDGSSWAQAVASFPGALEIVGITPDREIWMAGGTYALTASNDIPVALSVYGGFAGTETARAERLKKEDGKAWEFEHATVLNAEGFDGRVFGSLSTPFIMDGLTISGAKFSTDAGSVVSVGGDGVLTVQQCQFIGGSSLAGFISNLGGSTTITECSFSGIVCANEGGALRLGGGNNVVKNCEIINCTAQKNGGGIFVEGGATSVTVDNTLFRGNMAGEYGSAFCSKGGTSTLTNCVICSNTDGIRRGLLLRNTRPAIVVLSMCAIVRLSKTANSGFMLPMPHRS